MTQEKPKNRRRMLVIATSVAGIAGGLGVAAPLLMSMMPSARARAAGAPVKLNLGKIEPGMMVTVEWRGRPVWVLHRTEAMLKSLVNTDNQVQDPESKTGMQPEYAVNKHRSIRPQYLVLIGICTHLGCAPTEKIQPGEASGLGSDWGGGFYCPCHGSKFDLAGRVYKGVPAPSNLEVPPHMFSTDTELIIGVDKKKA